jgi:PadR family transcriptional regulator PadR
MSMQQPTFFVLTVLAEAPRHGYGITRAVEDLSGGTVVLRPGTLYAALDRLTVEGLVEVDREEVSAGGQIRRHYRLTGPGAEALRAEAEQRAATAALALGRLDRPGRARPATA